MAAQIYAYDVFKTLSRTALNLETDTFRATLMTSSFVLDAAGDAEWADVSATELAAGDGYVAGGVLLTGKVVDSSGWDASNPIWSSLGSPNPVSFRWLVILAVGTFDGYTDPLCLAVLLDDTPADITVSASDYEAVLNANGLVSW